jgi:hypothetical protein
MSATVTRTRRLADRAVIGLFLLLIGLPFAGTLLRLDLMPEGNELRRRAEFPTFTKGLVSIKKFPTAFEDWFNDHFGFRGPLIRALAFAKVRGLGVSTSSNVLLGRDDWLYYNHLQFGSDYEEMRPFTPEELEKWRLALESRQRWLRQHGIDYLVFLPPNKQTIYPEHLDPHLQPQHPSVRLAQLVDYLHQHSTVPVIDVRQQLLDAKQHERVYHVTDSHWNARGAFVGYHALVEELARRFPQIKPMERSQFEEHEVTGRGGDLSALIDLSDVYHEEYLDLTPRFPLRAHQSAVPVLYDHKKLQFPFGQPYALETGDTSLPRCLLLHDSFALALIPMLGEHFQRLATVWHDDFQPDIVLSERPDILIQQLLERKLGFVVPKQVGEE